MDSARPPPPLSGKLQRTVFFMAPLIGRFVRVWSIILETPLATLESGGSGVKTRGAGEGMPFKQGEEGAGEFSRKGGLLRTSFSGESTSLSPI